MHGVGFLIVWFLFMFMMIGVVIWAVVKQRAKHMENEARMKAAFGLTPTVSAQPVYEAQPGYGQPAYGAKPVYGAQPVYAQPVYGQPAYGTSIPMQYAAPQTPLQTNVDPQVPPPPYTPVPTKY